MDTIPTGTVTFLFTDIVGSTSLWEEYPQTMPGALARHDAILERAADANGGYDPESALKVAPKLADAGVDVLEAPLKPNRISSYQALKKQGALPILMDEGVISNVEEGLREARERSDEERLSEGE